MEYGIWNIDTVFIWKANINISHSSAEYNISKMISMVILVKTLLFNYTFSIYVIDTIRIHSV